MILSQYQRFQICPYFHLKNTSALGFLTSFYSIINTAFEHVASVEFHIKNCNQFSILLISLLQLLNITVAIIFGNFYKFKVAKNLADCANCLREFKVVEHCLSRLFRHWHCETHCLVLLILLSWRESCKYWKSLDGKCCLVAYYNRTDSHRNSSTRL